MHRNKADALFFKAQKERNMQTLTLKLTTAQQYEDHENKDEMVIQGHLAERNGSTYITFKQTDPDANITVDNRVKIKKGVVSIKRSGAVDSMMIFDEENPYTTYYETPYGHLNLYVTTYKVEHEVSEQGFKLHVHYEMKMQGKKVSDNRYCLETIK